MPKGRGSNRRNRDGGRRRVPPAGVVGPPPADRVKLVTEAMGHLGACVICGGHDLVTMWDLEDRVPLQTFCYWCGDLRHDWASGSIVVGGV